MEGFSHEGTTRTMRYIAQDFKFRLINLILRSDGKFCEIQNACALFALSCYFGFWHTFKLPILWAFICVVLSSAQAVAVVYNHSAARAYTAASAMFAWVALTTFVWISAHEALSIPLMFTFAVASSLTFCFQGLGGGRRRG